MPTNRTKARSAAAPGAASALTMRRRCTGGDGGDGGGSGVGVDVDCGGVGVCCGGACSLAAARRCSRCSLCCACISRCSSVEPKRSVAPAGCKAAQSSAVGTGLKAAPRAATAPELVNGRGAPVERVGQSRPEAVAPARRPIFHCSAAEDDGGEWAILGLVEAVPRGEHKVGCNQSSRTCASPQPSTLAAKANDAACRHLVSADDPATDYSERWLVAAEGKGSEARHETGQVHARVPSGAGRDR